MGAHYTYVLSEAASEFAFRLPRVEQRRLAVASRRLAANPHGDGDYPATDETGRTLHNLLLDDWVFTYWVDHAAKELRIIEVVQV